MSVKAIGWVWDNSQSEGAARLVLLAIADCANASGEDAWPSMAELCRKTRLSERGIQKAIRRLAELSELEVSHNTGRGRTNRYRIVMETPSPVRGSDRVNPEPRSPEQSSPPNRVRPQTPNSVRETPNHVRPEPSRTVSTTEPSPKNTPPATPGPPKGATTTKGTRLPDDFTVTEAMAEWARDNAPSCGTRDHEAFCDYWRGIPGAKGRKLDWVATWRNWMRREHERRTTNSRTNGGARRSTTDERVAQAQALKAELGLTSEPQLNLIRGELA